MTVTTTGTEETVASEGQESGKITSAKKVSGKKSVKRRSKK
jgi:hypothetical protein